MSTLNYICRCVKYYSKIVKSIKRTLTKALKLMIAITVILMKINQL